MIRTSKFVRATGQARPVPVLLLDLSTKGKDKRCVSVDQVEEISLGMMNGRRKTARARAYVRCVFLTPIYITRPRRAAVRGRVGEEAGGARCASTEERSISAERNERRRQRGFSQLVKFSRARATARPATGERGTRLIYGLRDTCKHESGNADSRECNGDYIRAGAFLGFGITGRIVGI